MFNVTVEVKTTRVVRYDKCYVLTNNLSHLPLVLFEASTYDELFSKLADWANDGGVFAESRTLVMDTLAKAAAPNEGMLGTAVSERLVLPEMGGMTIHFQLV